MPIDSIAFFGDSFCADFHDSYIQDLSKDYNILNMGEHGTGINFATEQLREFLTKNKEIDNIFFVLSNSASIRKQVLHENGERPMPFSSDNAGLEDFSDQFRSAIRLYEIYIQNDSEDKRNYINGMEAQQWLIHKFNIKNYKKFFCFKHEAVTYNKPFNFYYNNIEFTNLYDFSCYFEHKAPSILEYKNHFSPEGNKAMASIIREAINEYSN